MKSIIRIPLLLSLLYVSQVTYAQTASVALGNDRRAWFGINFGSVWQSSDIKPAFGRGAGFTLDYYLTRNTTSAFGLGFRGQYLLASTFGLGVKKDFNIQDNPSLNGSFGNPDYASLAPNKNYVYQNYATNFSDISGNIIISLNRLRAISRIHLYVFGGIGGTGYKARMDQLDGSGMLYTYDGAVNSSLNTFIKKDLRELRNGTYETYSENGKKRAWTLTPTIGAGFSIQVSSMVQLGFEHKVGFTRTDLLDGNRWSMANSRNDIFHYTTLGVNIGFGNSVNGRITGRHRSNVSYSYQSTDTRPIQSNNNLPVISITSPASTQVTLDDCVAFITARIENIQDRQSIQVTQNGIPVAFILNGNVLTISNIQFSGTAKFIITATNASGSINRSVSFICRSSDSMITICHHTRGAENQTISIPLSDWPVHAAHGDTRGECPVILPPVIRITSPATNPIVVQNCVAEITANIDNVHNKKDISITQNGVPVPFNWDGNIVAFSNIPFSEKTEFIITATNSKGTVEKSVSFVCRSKMITICHIPPGNTGNPQTMTIPESAWPAHAAHGDTQGACPTVLPPVVRITSPTTNPITVQHCVASFTANIDNVKNVRDITVTQNGVAVPFEWNGNTIKVSNIAFAEKAEFVISATNAAGSISRPISFICKSKMITICHIPPGNTGNPQTITISESAWPAHAAHGDTQGACTTALSPVVRITSPATSPITVQNCVAFFTATIENINDKKDISVTQNGIPVPFDWNGNTVTVSDVAFEETVEFIISATSSTGTSLQSVSFVCKTKMITICHIPPGNKENPQTITIPESAWRAHAAHGDTQGECPVNQPTIEDEEKKQQEEALRRQKAEEEKKRREVEQRRQFGNELKKVIGGEVKKIVEDEIKRQREGGERDRQAEEIKRQRDIEERKRQEEEMKKQRDIENKNQQDAELKKQKIESEKQQKEESERKQNEEADQKQKEEAENKQKEVDQKQKEEAEKKQKEEEEKKQKEEAEKKQREEAEKKRLEDEARRKKEEEDKKREDEKKQNNEEKITICHYPPGNKDNPQTITISASAWPAHEAHGDTKGACNKD